MTPPVLGPILPPVRRSVVVPWRPEAAFRRFTTEIGAWWPLATHSLGGERAVTCRFGEGVGDEIAEEQRDGTRCVWGRILVWEPPARVRFTWHPGEPEEHAQEVEVRFAPEGEGTRLELIHSGWERRGAKAKSVRRAYNLGWVYVLQHFEARRGFTVRALDLLHPLLSRLARRSRPSERGERAASEG